MIRQAYGKVRSIRTGSGMPMLVQASDKKNMLFLGEHPLYIGFDTIYRISIVIRENSKLRNVGSLPHSWTVV